MFSSHFIIMVVFRIINVCVIGTVIWWLSKKYLFTSVEETVAEKSAYTHGLDQQRKMLDTTYEQLEQEQIIQEQQCVHVLRNSQIWKSSYEQSLLQTQSQQEIIHRRVGQRMALLDQHQAEQMRQATIMPLVIEQTTKDLTDYFSDPKKADEFANIIIERVTKGLGQ